MMINEILASEVFGLLLRVTLVSLVGYAGIVSCRKRFPSLSIVIARVLLVAIWLTPIAMLLDWSLDVAVLPAAVDSRKTELAEHVPAATASVAPADSGPVQTISRNSPTNATRTIEDTLLFEEAPVVTLALPMPSQLGNRLTSASVAGWMYGLWVLGATVFLVSFGYKWTQTILCIRRSTACGEQITILATDVSDKLGITRSVTVRLSNSIHGPCTAGWIRPIVLLPESWMPGMSNGQTKMILAHELTHAQHRDSAWDALARITTACWWFHPIVFAITRQHRLACEHRCDAAATEIAGGSQSYRRQLAKWALAIRDSDQHAKLATLTALSMAERPLLLKRLSWLKNAQESRDVSSRQKWLLAMAMAALFTLVSIANPTQRVLASTTAHDGTAVVKQKSEQESKPTVNIEKGSENIEVPTLEVERTKMWQNPGKTPDLDWDNQVTVHGVVVSESGEPVSNAEVMITQLVDRHVVCGWFTKGSVLTNSRGELKVILPGGCRQFGVRTAASGFAKFVGDFEEFNKIEIRLQASNEQLHSLLHEDSKDADAKTKAALRSRHETEFKDALNSFSEFRPSKYLELQELNIISGGKTDKGDYLFVCDTKVVWLKSRKELMKMHVDFIRKFAKQHDGSITALALLPIAMQFSVIESTVPKFESGDVHSNRKIRVRGERAGDSIIVTSVTPSDFMVGSTGSAVDQLLQTIEALESNKLPTSTGNATIELKVDHKESQPAVGK